MDPDDTSFLANAMQLLHDDVPTSLVARGWRVTDLDIGDDEPLEFFWPPTAPLDYGGHANHDARSGTGANRRRPELAAEQLTPWIQPTRITSNMSSWRVDYGTAIAQQPDPPTHHGDDAGLLADLERIECWPMSVDEARQIRMQRVVTSTVADAQDDHLQAVTPTEPYASRLAVLRQHRMADLSDLKPRPSTPRPRGNLEALLRLVDAEAWASAVRTARAGGPGWDINGPEQT